MIRIARGLELPDDVATQSLAILARRGAGKTHTASVLVEEVVRARLPVVVLDPTGAWWGLRSSADGAKPGLPVVILGGEHRDVPLEATAGAVIADLVVDHPGAYVVDLSGFTSKAAEQRFAADFLERLYRAKTTRRDPLLLVVDEADSFAPQRPGTEQIRTLGALEAIVRRGRIRGLGCVLISQRAAVLNKNVLTQVEVLVVMQTTSPQDRAAVDAWIEGNGTREERDEVLASLAGLQRGEAWVWSPAWLRILLRVTVRPRHTFDSSKTPEAGQQRIEPRAFATVDLEQLGERIRATAEQAKANDPAVLRQRIRELEGQLSSKKLTALAQPEVVERIVEVPVLNGQVDKLLEVVGEMRQIGSGLVLIGTGIGTAADSIVGAIDRVNKIGTPQPAGSSRVAAAAVRPRAEAAPIPRQREGRYETAAGASPEEAPGLTAYARRLVETLASRHPLRPTRAQLAVLSRSSPRSSSFDASIAELRRGGYVDVVDGEFRLTEAGFAVAGSVPSVATTPEALLEQWRAALDPSSRILLDVLVAAYPGPVSRDELAERSGRSPTSSSFDAAIATLRKMGLASGDRSGYLASADLVGP